MNHQVEDDVDVEAALGKNSQAMDLDEPRRGDEREHGRDGRVVALGVTDGKRRARLLRGGDHLVSLREGACHRLLDEHRDPLLEERHRDVAVQLGRHRDGHCIDLAAE